MGQICNIKKPCVHRLDKNICAINLLCQPVIDKCLGCGKIVGEYCTSYAIPANKWTVSKNCPMATHIKAELKQERKINPLKQSKQSMKSKQKTKK